MITNFTTWFEPVPSELLQEKAMADTWEKNIIIHKGRFPKWQRKHIALLGVSTLNTDNLNPTQHPANQVRKKLYDLKKGTGTYQIVDLGNLIAEKELVATQQKLAQVCEKLLEHQVLPIVIGDTHALDYGQFQAYESQGRLINVVNVDAKIDVEDVESAPPAHTHTQTILSHKPNFLFCYNHLAYQRFLNSKQALNLLEQFYFEAYSVGQLRKDLQEIEPLIRQADMLSFDIQAIKMEYAPAHPQAQLLGLNVEEACQICWFAGLSEKIASLGIYEYHPEYDERQKTASLIATMVWYFVEGYYHRVKLKDFNSSAFMKYLVATLDHNNQNPMVFYKHKVTQKWWMEVPYPNELSQAQEAMIVPCSYKDYQTANKGEVPDRWISTYAKLT